MEIALGTLLPAGAPVPPPPMAEGQRSPNATEPRGAAPAWEGFIRSWILGLGVLTSIGRGGRTRPVLLGEGVNGPGRGVSVPGLR